MMEYSPMMVIVLWALTPSDCHPLGQQNSSEEVAKVKELKGPSMTMKEEVIPGYFTFNDGQPFLVEKDPLTGSLNFNIKTTPVKSSQQFYKDDDYLYEDETGYGKDNIDRKDGDIYGLKTFGQNDIKDNSKEDLHKFLNLPVHYSTKNKFPLISSSYANTKVQGHGSSSLSNHKPYTTSTEKPSTSSPTYYTQTKQTMQTTTTTTTPKPTTTYRTTTSAYDYEYVDYYDDKYDQESSEKPVLNFIPSGLFPPSSPSTSKPTTLITFTTTNPTTRSTTTTTTSTTTTTTKKPTYYTETTRPTTVSTTTEEKVAIVTSLPIDSKVHESELDKTPLSIKLSTTTNKIDFMTTQSERDNIASGSKIDDSSSNVVVSQVSEKPDGNDLEFGMRLTTLPPFRGPSLIKTKPEPVGFGYGVQVSNGVPGLRPPPWGYGGVPPFQPIGSVHPHQLPPKRPPQLNPDFKPNTDNHPKPNKVGPPHPTPPHTYLTVGSNHPPFRYPPAINQNQPSTNNKPPSFFPEDQAFGSSINHQTYDNSIKHKRPENADNFNIVVGNFHKFPQQRINGSVLPPENKNNEDELALKSPHPTKTPSQSIEPPITGVHYGPKRPIGFPENSQQPQEGFSLVPDNQFVKVPHDHASPSYSLQTSFSIGSPNYDEDKEVAVRPMQGIGQVLFPDDDKVVESNSKRPNWSSSQQNGPPAPQHQNGPGQHKQNGPNYQGGPGSHYQHGQGPNYQGPATHHQNGPGPNYQGSGPHHPNGPQSGQGQHHQNGPQFQGGPNSHNANGPRLPPQPRPPQRFPPDMPGNENAPHQRPIQRYPPEMQQPSGEAGPHQRPPWDSHVKHPYNAYAPGMKKDPMGGHPPNFGPQKRPSKPQNPQRGELPNILPQFRPNAKVGGGEYHGPPHPNHPPFVNPPKIREPFDTLQPPPLPRPQFLRLNNNDEPMAEKKIDKKEQLPVHLPLVHKRMSGPQSGSRVTPLGLIPNNNPPPRNIMHRNDFKDFEKKKDEPVFVVYPSNPGNVGKGGGNAEGVVVVGTRGSQRPLPPDNLGLPDDLDPFPLDDNGFPMNGRDRTDTPILKSKSTTKPKLEFPYNLAKPGSVEPPQKIINSGAIDLKKEYTAYSPTVSASTEEMLLKDHDHEINLIPYLQDYMPFATKKPLSKPIEGWNIEDKSTLKPWNSDKSTLKPLSVTLNTFMGSTNKPIRNHLIVTERTDSPEPERQDFEAPFLASLSEPSQGWSVVTQTATTDKSVTPEQPSKPTEPTKFDMESFKPELLSGFKPILPPKFDDDRPTTKASTALK